MMMTLNKLLPLYHLEHLYQHFPLEDAQGGAQKKICVLLPCAPRKLYARLLLLILSCSLSLPTIAQDAQTYTVKRGDTLLSIAHQFDLTVADLQRINGLQGTLVKVGTALIVERPEPEPETTPIVTTPTQDPPPETSEPPISSPPDAEQESPPESTPSAESSEPITYGSYDVQAGDTFFSLATQFGIPTETLLTLNDSVSTYLEIGQSLRLPPEFATTTHRVRRGENLYRIALKYGTSISAIRDLNNLRSDGIRIGQRLNVPAEKTPPARNANALPPIVLSGQVILYPPTFSGRPMASGRPYDHKRFTVSHPDLPFGTIVLLTNTANDRVTFAEVTDRGPLDPNFILDISGAAAQQLRLDADSNTTIDVRVIE